MSSGMNLQVCMHCREEKISIRLIENFYCTECRWIVFPEQMEALQKIQNGNTRGGA